MKAAAESAAAAAAAVGAAGSSAVVASGALSGSRSMARADERLRAVLEEKRRRQGAPPPSSALAAGLMGADALFPTLTHVVILKDTWTGLVQHMHELGLAAVVKLFKINYNLRSDFKIFDYDLFFLDSGEQFQKILFDFTAIGKFR